MRRVTALGLPQPPGHLPLLDATGPTRSTVEVVRRLSCLSAVAAVAHGCPVTTAQAWLEGEGLLADLTPAEHAYLGRQAHAATDPESSLPEGIYALAWAIGWLAGADQMDEEAPRTLVTTVPGPPPGNPVEASPPPVPVDAVALLDALDTAYCAHWGLVENRLHGQPSSSPEEWVVVERRRAWEWLTTDDAWDDVPLDT